MSVSFIFNLSSKSTQRSTDFGSAIQDPIKPLERSKKVNSNYWLNSKTCWVRGPNPDHQIVENEIAKKTLPYECHGKVP